MTKELRGSDADEEIGDRLSDSFDNITFALDCLLRNKYINK